MSALHAYRSPVYNGPGNGLIRHNESRTVTKFDFTFINVNNPIEFKAEANKKIVRQTVMENHLSTPKKECLASRPKKGDFVRSASRESIHLGVTANETSPLRISALRDSYSTPSEAPGTQPPMLLSSTTYRGGLEPESPGAQPMNSHSVGYDEDALDTFNESGSDTSSVILSPHRNSHDWSEPSSYDAGLRFPCTLLNFLSAQLKPFISIPQHSKGPIKTVEEMKYYCKQYFGSMGIRRYWLPALMESPHAFMSSFQDTTRVQTDVLRLIHESLDDPMKQASDVTIIAVLHYLVIVAIKSPEQLNCHVKGIKEMVDIRGGLGKLGVNGELAAILTA
ncbi:hypothetical protein B0A49_07090 [Cryomyces minteri]|uniref:Uncharacterized protein n=1 Tax=Cryomyces minteri TaxID=331657 RepID=A0A4V5NDB0_9PEZI|nr:hypothetical protein B0A49_07090 [Cryomyces minteri]